MGEAQDKKEVGRNKMLQQQVKEAVKEDQF